MKTQVLVFVLLTVYINLTNCAKILGIVGMPSFSHQAAFRPLWRELSLRGHQVTVLTSDPMNDPALTNLTEIDLHDAYDIVKRHDIVKYLADHKLEIWKVITKFTEMSDDIMTFQMTHPEVAKLIHNETEYFDVLIVEMYFLPQLGFSTRFNCPYIGVLSLDGNVYMHEIMGNPTSPAMYADVTLPFDGKLTFLQRLINALYQSLVKLMVKGTFPHLDEMTKGFFGSSAPPVSALLKNISLLFLNANSMLHTIRPLTPATVLIGGGTHLTASKALPEVGVYGIPIWCFFFRLF